MAQKMQTYDEMSTTKGHPWVPQESHRVTKESQDYVLRSPNVERKKKSDFWYNQLFAIVFWLDIVESVMCSK